MDGADSERLSLQVERDGRLETWHGQGSGPIDAMVKAVGLPFDVLSYEEHSRGEGSGAKAVSYIEITTRSRRTLFGAGMHSNIITASLSSAILENKRLDVLRQIGEKGNLIITDSHGGATPLINVAKK